MLVDGGIYIREPLLTVKSVAGYISQVITGGSGKDLSLNSLVMNNGSTLHYRTTILDYLIKIISGLEVEQAYDYLDKRSEAELNHIYAMIKRKEYLELKELFEPYVTSTN